MHDGAWSVVGAALLTHLQRPERHGDVLRYPLEIDRESVHVARCVVMNSLAAQAERRDTPAGERNLNVLPVHLRSRDAVRERLTVLVLRGQPDRHASGVVVDGFVCIGRRRDHRFARLVSEQSSKI